ncbi:MAG: Na+/H+ antiporter subunit E [Bacteroidales bacterium]|nr:Na+/H+ antiporter subunit E [Bacteroidales bacterium]MCF8458210.1 Na+/H+ antiporter subunit E [Bacteroidales bacterium]
MNKFKNFIIIFFILFVVWMLLNNSYTSVIIISGLIVSFVVAAVFCSNCNVFTELKLTPKSILYSFVYIVVFLKELVKSNLDVAFRVISPSLPINPGIVEVKTKLKSKMGRLILADTITLTPGTFTVDIHEETLYIHWIDVKSDDINKATKEIVSKFEKYLEVIYG